jgi:gamma-glutamyltranspeptidase/glutathione hydrolase
MSLARSPVAAAAPSSAIASLALIILASVGLSCSRGTAGPGALTPMSGKRVEGSRGMVSASHPDAAAAGAEALRLGGNAIDAAVATGFALSVVDVSQTGLGGGGALTYYDARTRRAEHLSFYPRAGEDPAWGRADTAATRRQGRGAATPGMVAGLLEAHSRWGRLTRAQVMAPAIRLAREGFIVSPLLARTIASSATKLALDASAAARFLPRGQALRPGDRLVQPELAATLLRVSFEGRDAFYTGTVAEQLSARTRELGGLITVRDLATYPVATMRPLCAAWRGYTVMSAPPPMGGASVLEMLQMADMAGVAELRGFTEQPEAVARLADILRLGGADGGRWRGDPAVLGIPARGVASAAYARQRAGLVAGVLPDTALAGDPWAFDSSAAPAACAALDPYPPSIRSAPGNAVPGERELDATTAPADSAASTENTSFTSHLAVVDAEGNAVSATTTVGVLFGSGVYTGGFFLNSAGGNFDARTRGTNRSANSTMSPTMILDRGKVRLVVGAAGSQYIQPSIVQVTLRMLAFGEDPATALAGPRIYASAASRDVEVEPGFSPAVYQALVTRGYRPLSRVADISFGGVHAVFVRPDGRRIGVADPRRDGAAAGN